MANTIRKLAKSKAEQIGRVSLGNTDFTVAVDGNLVLALVNGYRVADAPLHQDPISGVIPILAALATKIFQKSWYAGAVLNVYEGEWDTNGKYPSLEFMEAMVSALNKTIGSSSIKIHKNTDPAPKFINKQTISFNQEALENNLAHYSKQITLCLKLAEHLVDKTEVFTRIKLVKSTWGMDKVVNDINGIKAKLKEIEELFNVLGSSVNIANKAVSRLQSRISKNVAVSQDDKNFVVAVLVPDILVTFDKIKKSLIAMVTILAPLYNLERSFKEYTGNPISWSIPGSLVEDFKESFSVIIDFLVDIPSVEMDVMEPLEVLQTKLKSRVSNI